MRHPCHADQCSVNIAPKFLMCARHWAMVPRRLQRELWAAYEPGQEDRKDPTPEYLVIQERCVTAVAVKEGLITSEVAEERVLRRSEEAGFISQMLPLFYQASTSPQGTQERLDLGD